MTERLRRVLRFVVGRPALTLITSLCALVVVVAIAAGSAREPPWVWPVVVGCLATAYVSVVQALRVLWRHRRPGGLLLASVILGAGFFAFRETGSMADAALAWSPLAGAVLLDLAIGRLRAWRGPLWLDRPSDAAPTV